MVYTIRLDNDIDARIKEFNDKLPRAEKIVQMTTSGEYLFIVTENRLSDFMLGNPKPRNLLLEEMSNNKGENR
jgi:hypothetical protein